LLVNLRGGWKWPLFGIIWGLALAGILLKVWFVDHFKFLSPLVYLLMGWLGIVAFRSLLASVPRGALLWLLAGGAIYSIGVVFYASKRIPYAHTIWHIFVMAGSTCHYFAVLFSVLPPAKT
jgi:hemolysin III